MGLIKRILALFFGYRCGDCENYRKTGRQDYLFEGWEGSCSKRKRGLVCRRRPDDSVCGRFKHKEFYDVEIEKWK